MTIDLNVGISPLNTSFTATYTATDETTIDASTVSLLVMYYDTQDAFDSGTSTYSFTLSNDVDASTDITSVFSINNTLFEDELISDGVYVFSAVAENSEGVKIENTDKAKKTFNDYYIKIKLVKDTINLGDQMESNNTIVEKYFKNEWLQAISNSSNYCATTSALLSKAMKQLDYMKKITKYY